MENIVVQSRIRRCHKCKQSIHSRKVTTTTAAVTPNNKNNNNTSKAKTKTKTGTGTAKMSDWGDNDTEVIEGKGFTSNDKYKTNDDYQNEDDNNNNNDGGDNNDDRGGYNNNRRNGFGGGRGRNGGGGRGGDGRNFGNRNNDDNNDENGEFNVEEATTNRNVIVVSSHIYTNPIFDLIPKPQPGEDQTSYIKKFVNQIAALFAKANILQKYVLFKYVMEIYGQVLENEQAKWRPKIKPLPPSQRKERPRIQATINVTGDGEDGENARANVQSIEEVMPIPPVGQGEAGGVASEIVEDIRLDLSAVNNENVYLLPPDEGSAKEKDDMMTSNFVGKYLDNIDDHLGVSDFENFNVAINNSSMTSYPTMSQHLIELNESNNLPSVMGQVPTTEQRQQQQQQETVFHTPKTRYHLRPRSSALLASLAPADTTPPGQRRTAALRRSSSSSETTPTQRPINHQRRRRFLTEDEYSLCLPMRKRKIIAEARLPLPRTNVCHTVVSYYSMDFSLIREEFSHALHGRSFFARAESSNANIQNNRTTEPSLVIISPEETRNPPPPPSAQPPAAIDQLQNSTLDQVRHINSSHMMPGNLVDQHLLVPPHQETAVHQSNISAMDDVRQAPSNLGGDLSLPLRMTSQKQLAPENLPSSFAATAGEANNSLQIAAEDFGIPPPPQPRGDQIGDLEIPVPPSAIQEAEELLQPPFPALDGRNTSAHGMPDDVLMPPPPPPPETSANASGLESSNLLNITEYNPLRPLPTPDSGAPGLNVSHYPRLHGEDEGAEPTPQAQLSASDSALASAGLDKTLRNPLVAARPTPDSGVPNISAGNLSKFKTPMLQGSADVPEGGATLSSADEDQFHSNLQRQREISMASTPIRRPSQDLSVSARPSLAKTIDIHTSNEESGSNNTTTTQLANMGPSSQVQQQQLGISQLPRITEEFAIRPSTFEQQIPIAATIPEMSQSTNQSSNAAGGDAGWYRDWLAILRDRQQNPNYTNTTLPQRKRRRRHPRIKRPRRLNVDEEEEEGPIINVPQNIDAPEIAGSGGNSLSKAAAVQAFFSAFIPETTASPTPQPPPAIVINDGPTNGGFTAERRGFGGGRGRGRGDRDGGGRREFNNNKGENEYGDNKEEGGEPQKPREFYIPPEPTDNEEEIFGSGITSGINFSKYDSIPVQVTGENAPPAIQSFEEAAFRELVLNNVKRSGYKLPTPIQKTAIPVISSGRDLMACAQTGSGKTAAFLLPIINSLLNEGCETSIGKPQALIVSPTRELAIQIYNEARKFSMDSYINTQIVYGGTSSKHQGEKIGRGGTHILIATPGRLLDFVEKGFITFEETRFVVLDEADRMLDMGFKESVATIMNHPTMRSMDQRQNLMFSATFPAEIQRMAGEYLNEYIFIAIGVVGGACSDVTQNVYEVKKYQKRAKLMELLQENPNGTIVFVETKRGADFLASLLSETEFPTTSIHGDRLQRQREEALADFKSGKMKVLIATSVAARGLDIKNVNHVVNYDLPTSIDEYVHRIGRTGRVGNNGRATSFFDPENDTAIAGDLVKILEGAGQEVPDFLQNFSSGGGGGGGDYGNGSRFGGRDVRKNVPQNDDNFVTSSGPAALEEEEEWN